MSRVVLTAALSLCGSAALPSTRVRCLESPHLGSGPSADFVRTCSLRDAYWTRRTGFVALGASSSVCPVRLRHATLRYDIPTVSALPAGDVGTVEAPTFVDQKYHGCFSHRFLEEYFALYWVAAERQQTWDIDARQVQVYLDGPVTKRNEAKMFKTQVNRDTGRVHVKGSPDHYFAALSADQRVLHADVAILQQHTVWRFTELTLGGFTGRTPWNGMTLGYTRSEHRNEPDGVGGAQQLRTFTQEDKEYSVAEKSAAAMQYMRYLSTAFGAAPHDPAAPPRTSMHIVFLNREPAKQLKDKPRRVTNAKEIISALVAAFAGRDQVTVDPVEHLPNTSPKEIISLMHNSSIVISPHGSQVSNVGFSRHGDAALLELFPRCHLGRQTCYAGMAKFWNIHYGKLVSNAPVFHCDTSFAISPERVVRAVAGLIAKLKIPLGARSHTLDVARRRLDVPPRNASHWRPVTC